ncbi:hypothetical protein [Moorena sp. SIO4G3]|uniref:hypothetical protein n=1 Tax=Moorena sp. SIO4G3 TaxID=2607821 RepID=UPI0025F99766|nr:hypothetical protein [Moorena sp. SIO4G3]
MRGAPAHYDELKRQHGIWLIDTTWKWLQLSAKDSGVSVGEYIESWARRQITDICSRSVAFGQGAIHPHPLQGWGISPPQTPPISLKVRCSLAFGPRYANGAATRTHYLVVGLRQRNPTSSSSGIK